MFGTGWGFECLRFTGVSASVDRHSRIVKTSSARFGRASLASSVELSFRKITHADDVKALRMFRA